MKIGMYNFQWAGGEFEVEFREKNIFWCKRFANEASWTEVQPGVVGVNWGKYGNYQLTAQPDGSFAGGVLTTDASGAPVVNRVRVTLSTAGYLQPNDALKYTTEPGGAPVPRVGAASALALEPVVLYSHVMLLERVGCVP